MRLTMSKVSRRRTNQFCDFVPVLKFGAVDFHDRAGRTEQYLCSRLYNSCLSTTRWTQKQKVRDRPAGRRQSGLKNLKELHQCPDSFFLSYDLPPQGQCELLHRLRLPRRIEPVKSIPMLLCGHRTSLPICSVLWTKEHPLCQRERLRQPLGTARIGTGYDRHVFLCLSTLCRTSIECCHCGRQ